TPGRMSGSATRRNTWNRVAPSIAAAASRSTGTSSKNPFESHSTSGTTVLMWASTIAIGVLSNCSDEKIEYIGSTIDVDGIISVARIASAMTVAPRNEKREIA